jgi:CRP/FNR family transcriptional regulator, anaerobic regulatory protein
MSFAPSACATCPVRETAACAALSSEERAKLAAMGSHRDYRRGQMVMAAGDDNIASATLISGALKVSAIDADGNEQILSVIHPAGFVGEMFAPIAHHDVVALTDSRLCLFSRADYEAAVHQFPALAEALLRRSSAELIEARSLLDLKGRRSAEAKVAGLIMAFARSASDSSCHAAGHFDLPLSRNDIASLLGLTIETVSRQITVLERAGLITRKGARGIDIRDAPALEALAS